jgi:hypothetical protein
MHACYSLSDECKGNSMLAITTGTVIERLVSAAYTLAVMHSGIV